MGRPGRRSAAGRAGTGGMTSGHAGRPDDRDPHHRNTTPGKETMTMLRREVGISALGLLAAAGARPAAAQAPAYPTRTVTIVAPFAAGGSTDLIARLVAQQLSARSEEHTSELQSRQYLVCRLLLEKKKHTPTTITRSGLLLPPTCA